ncbi:ADP-ribosylhydrolase ARH3 isoform X3 [Haemorhous mexicanus]|uniref:ADP-ribosylhydrolase ARH3 isoform X3 n=1 Tax=Haemorhous mexicanus TaxID=30427 RepID=UPI0028BF581D|nr:ADP-ribosylhydrolase ARH3 isoform X3 [Haemorhous mexicanus]
MAAEGPASGAGRVPARPRPGLARFRGCLAGALLGDCLGAVFEGRSVVKLPELLSFLKGLEPAPPEEGGEAAGSARGESLPYTDDTAMSRSVVQSLLAKQEFDEVDMAKRFAEEYKKEPNRGYGMAVVNVFKKLLSPKCSDVFEPARAQFNGKGSYGNGGAMRVAGIPLVYSDIQDVKKFAKLSAELTHANSLGYNGAILQALAVHLALQEGLSKETFLEQLISHMEHVEADDKSLSDARALGFEDLPFSRRLKKIKEFLELSSVPKADVLFELGMCLCRRTCSGMCTWIDFSSMLLAWDEQHPCPGSGSDCSTVRKPAKPQDLCGAVPSCLAQSPAAHAQDYKSNHTESGVNRRDCPKAQSGKTGVSKPGTWASDGLEGNFSIQHGSLLLYGFVGLESTVGFSCSCLGSAERMVTERAKTGDNPSPRPASPELWETFNPFGLKRKLLDMYSRA